MESARERSRCQQRCTIRHSKVTFVTSRNWAGSLAAAAALSAAQVSSQTTEQFDRINTLARYGMVMAWCEKLGMKLAPDWETQIDSKMTAEGKSWGLAPEASKQIIDEAVTRQAQISKID